jgi:hypothetical protein
VVFVMSAVFQHVVAAQRLTLVRFVETPVRLWALVAVALKRHRSLYIFIFNSAII